MFHLLPGDRHGVTVAGAANLLGNHDAAPVATVRLVRVVATFYSLGLRCQAQEGGVAAIGYEQRAEAGSSARRTRPATAIGVTAVPAARSAARRRRRTWRRCARRRRGAGRARAA